MHQIWIQYTSGKISGKEAMSSIGEELKTVKDKDERKLLQLISDKILDQEVPFSERDAEAEQIFSSGIGQAD